jgi:hypothetical protein
VFLSADLAVCVFAEGFMQQLEKKSHGSHDGHSVLELDHVRSQPDAAQSLLQNESLSVAQLWALLKFTPKCCSFK